MVGVGLEDVYNEAKLKVTKDSWFSCVCLPFPLDSVLVWLVVGPGNRVCDIDQ